MRSMAEQFVEYLRDAEVSKDLILAMERLLAKDYDMEHAIETIDKIVGAEQAKQEIGLVGDSSLIAYDLIREEAEWFVQHVCERVDTHRAAHMWSPVLKAATSNHVVIASTNYDRAIEIAAARARIRFADGFEAFNHREYSPWLGAYEPNAIKLLKLHGSTDWYHGDDGKVFKLRHPMPLFGNLEVNSGAGLKRLRSALVLPSREKKISHPPFPALQASFRNDAMDADVAFFVGSSLRDPHFRDVCAECAKRIPTYVVTRFGISPTNLPPGAIEIHQTSGEFLISTLPAYLNDASTLPTESSTTTSETFSPLENIIRAADVAASDTQRTSAIEALAQSQARLGKDLVQSLLQSDRPEIRLYALGLIHSSYHRAELLEFAKSLATDANDETFAEELELLVQLSGATSKPDIRAA